jgi:hypothetical protein
MQLLKMPKRLEEFRNDWDNEELMNEFINGWDVTFEDTILADIYYTRAMLAKQVLLERGVTKTELENALRA